MIKKDLKKIIFQLDYSWFEKLKKEFQSNDFYNKEKNLIIGKHLHEEALGPDGKWEFEIDLVNYAWTNSIPESNFWWDLYSKHELINCGYSISNGIIKYTNELLDKTVSNIDKSRLISNIAVIIESLYSELINLDEDKDHKVYIDALKKIQENTSNQFFNYYYKLNSVLEITSDINSFLKFDLNQNELAAFLLLIEKSDLVTNKKGDLGIRQFAINHFLFKDINEYKPAVYVGNKMSDMFGGEIDFRNYYQDILEKFDKAKEFILEHLSE